MRRISTLPDVQSLKAFASQAPLPWKLTGCAPPQLGDKQKRILDMRETRDGTQGKRKRIPRNTVKETPKTTAVFSRPGRQPVPTGAGQRL